MQVITAPSTKNATGTTLFLAGGISNSPNWQSLIIERLEKYDVAVFNPRRKKFPKGRVAERKQISWEHVRLRRADIVCFWFSPETLDPITLFELGAALERKAILVIGIHPDYRRKFDVEVQVSLQRPNQKIHHSFTAFIRAIEKSLTTENHNR